MTDLIPLVTEQNGTPITTSRAVAEQFGKAHKNVIRDIDNIVNQLKIEPVTSDFAEKNFILTSAPDSKGEERPIYILTRDGFTLLAMGFTGAKAMQFKVAYINAFDRMESLLKDGITSDRLIQLEERLTALENGPGQDKGELDNISESFLSALRTSLQNGECYIFDKSKRNNEPPQGELVGRVYGSKVALYSLKAYEIYRRAVAKPMTIKAIWQVLEHCGTIAPRKEYPKKIFINGADVSVIYIEADKLRI